MNSRADTMYGIKPPIPTNIDCTIVGKEGHELAGLDGNLALSMILPWESTWWVTQTVESK